MAERNYYEVLGIAQDASADDIKKAYRKLVRQYHPDVCKAPDADEKTSEINLAYETLHDPNKRAEYDAMQANPFGHASADGGQQRGFQHQQYQFDPSHFGQGGAFGGGDFRFDDIFSAFGSAGHRGFRQQHAQGPVAGEDQHAQLSIDIQAAYQGAQRSLSLDMPTLDAQGNMTYARKTLSVTIPQGITEGQQIRLAGQGLPGFNGGASGDLYLKIQFHNNEALSVHNRKDVHQRINVAPWTAALGGKLAVRTPAGSLALNLPANSRNGQKIRLKGKGIPAKTAGDLYLQVNIILPACDNDHDKAAWAALAAHYAGFQAPQPSV